MSQLSQIRLFTGLPDAVLQSLEHGATIMEPRHGVELFAQGADPDAVYAIVGGHGSVRIGSIDRRGKRLMVEVFVAGDIFGEVGVLDGGPRTASACTEGQVRLLRISAAAFLAAMQATPGLGLNLARALSQRLRRTFALFQDATFETLDIRLARQLLYLAAQHGRPSSHGIVLANRLRQADLADLLGATTRSIITILNDWRATGMVAYDTDTARMTISNPAAMQQMVESVS
jgi:CRP-like cAMP-binding protein